MQLCSDIARYFKKLEYFAFEISRFRAQNKMAVQHVMKMIAKLSNLKSLRISFAAQVDNEYIDEISCAIGKKLRKLQSLTLWFHGGNEMVTDEGLEKLASNIFPALSQLTYFAFSLDDNDQITDDGVTHFGTDIANHLNQLETLIFSFNSAERLTTTLPSKLTQAFRNSLLSLRKLVLNFEWIEENSSTKERYHIFLPEQVQHLELYLYGPDCLIDEGWANLKQLALVIGACCDDTDFVDMFPKYSLSLKNLTQLKLIFSSPGKVTDKKSRKFNLCNWYKSEKSNQSRIGILLLWTAHIRVPPSDRSQYNKKT